jgi:dihydroorotase
VLRRPDDFHAHFRQGAAMALYVAREAASFGRAIAMPNTLPPVADAAGIAGYRRMLEAAVPRGLDFQPLMTFKLLPGMDAPTVRACAAAGAVAGKYYPAGATTNAADGPRNPEEVAAALAAMEESGIILSIHGEAPDAPAFEREARFLDTVASIMDRWPRLRIVLEHLSSAAAADFVAAGPQRLAGTITAHHLLCTADDFLGGGLNPHLFCKPIIKFAADRDALRKAAFSGSPKFFFGSDTAPHPRAVKESGSAPGGIYSAPTAIPALAGLFERSGALPAFENFVAGFGAGFYSLEPPRGTLRLRREPWRVPDEIDGAVPLCAGTILDWRLA